MKFYVRNWGCNLEHQVQNSDKNRQLDARWAFWGMLALTPFVYWVIKLILIFNFDFSQNTMKFVIVCLLVSAWICIVYWLRAYKNNDEMAITRIQLIIPLLCVIVLGNAWFFAKSEFVWTNVNLYITLAVVWGIIISALIYSHAKAEQADPKSNQEGASLEVTKLEATIKLFGRFSFVFPIAMWVATCVVVYMSNLESKEFYVGALLVMSVIEFFSFSRLRNQARKELEKLGV
ncbi:MAG: hypothetical protein JKX72_09095 [Robiginitomaculum sp.]|nr:hypothetical protein [Robiginitomaculum sp.]